MGPSKPRYVGFPTGDGDPIAADFPVVNGEVPLPTSSDFDKSEIAGLDEAARADFRNRAIPAPAYVDLPTGHWPQLTRPAELAEVVLEAVRPER